MTSEQEGNLDLIQQQFLVEVDVLKVADIFMRKRNDAKFTSKQFFKPNAAIESI